MITTIDNKYTIEYEQHSEGNIDWEYLKDRIEDEIPQGALYKTKTSIPIGVWRLIGVNCKQEE